MTKKWTKNLKDGREATLLVPSTAQRVVRSLSQALSGVYITLPLGESSLSEERASDLPASGRVNCLYFNKFKDRTTSQPEWGSVQAKRGFLSASKSNPHRQLISLDTGRVVVAELQVADSFWHRFVGLQFRRELPAGHGLLLVPCRSIHTCWMRFAIDVIFLDLAGTVLEVHQAVRPWRAVAARSGRPHAVLELPARSAQLEPGERLQIVDITLRRDAVVDITLRRDAPISADQTAMPNASSHHDGA